MNWERSPGRRARSGPPVSADPSSSSLRMCTHSCLTPFTNQSARGLKIKGQRFFGWRSSGLPSGNAGHASDAWRSKRNKWWKYKRLVSKDRLRVREGERSGGGEGKKIDGHCRDSGMGKLRPQRVQPEDTFF